MGETKQAWKAGKIRYQLPALAHFYEDLGLSLNEICFLLNRDKESVKNQVHKNGLRRKWTPSASHQKLSTQHAASLGL
jgi:hypothetical protein